MLLAAVALILMAVFVIYSRLRVPGTALAGLGAMSERWRAQHRASNPS